MSPWEGQTGPRDVVVCSLVTGDALVRWPDVVGPLAFSRDGSRLVAGVGDRVRVLDLCERAELGQR